MSAAPVQLAVQSSHGLFLVPPIQPRQRETSVDRHPWLPVLIAASIAMTVAVLFAGTIAWWLLLRHNGIDARW
jgi:hypothetical protein